MPAPILLTKLNIPQLRNQRVNRPLLIQKINDGLSGKLTLVSAPAGYGKTSLVLEWLSQFSSQYNIGWISLDESDNDPVRFLSYIIAAIRQTVPNFGDTVSPLLQSPQRPPDEVILTTLLNQIAAISSPVILVLDDYHTIQTPQIHKQLAIWLERQPISMHLVIISREDPLLPIARLRGQGHLTEIRQDDLRFTYQECLDLLQNVMDIKVSPRSVAALERRTEGWITGLQLAAISLQHHQEPDQFIEDFSGSSRFILDYLIDEVFKRQSHSMQDFLIKTSILERISGPLCQAVSGQEQGQERLEALEKANLFIIPLDQSRTWYRYHRLFSELLRNRLRKSEGQSITDLHDRASHWFEQNGFVAEGIQHAIAAQNWERVTYILSQVNDEMLKSGESATLVRWYSAIPEDKLLQDPRTCFDYSWPLLLSGHYTKAAQLLDHLEGIAQDIPVFLGEIFTAQAFLARALGQHDRMFDRSKRARALLPSESVVSRGIVAINLGLAYWHLGQMQAAEEVLLEVIETSQNNSNQYALITAIILQGRVLAVRGQLKSAARKFKQAIESGGRIPINALAHLDMCALNYEWDQLEEAESHLQKALELSRRGQNKEFQVACWMMESTLRLARGNLGAAKVALTRAGALIDKGTIPKPTVSRYDVARLRFALAQGNLGTALRLSKRSADNVDSHNFCRFTNLAKAKFMLVQNQAVQAQRFLAGLADRAENEGWLYALITIRAFQSLASDTDQAAVHFLKQALELAQPEGFMRTFVDIGADLIPLLHQIARSGFEPAYVGQVLTAIQNDMVDDIPDHRSVEQLSEREQEVLRLLVAGLSNREIAHDLVISLGTAKTHIHNIYGKLEVKNRAQAISRAQEINLV